MIIHHTDDFSRYLIALSRPLKYSEEFTFIPIRLHFADKYQKCVIQTPLLFTPFGIQGTMNNKRVIDLSFQNKRNDPHQIRFLNTLRGIYKTICRNYNSEYNVNSFLKETNFDECIRLKLTSNTTLFDEYKTALPHINRFTYGHFIIHLEGIWINNNDIWFQWTLLQARVQIPLHLQDYSFIDDHAVVPDKIDDKYDKMIKMGVPKAAVMRQKMMDLPTEKRSLVIHSGPGPPPPPPPPLANSNKTTNSIPKIKASDLQSVKLKKNRAPRLLRKKTNASFEPPTLEELQSTLSRLKPVS